MQTSRSIAILTIGLLILLIGTIANSAIAQETEATRKLKARNAEFRK